MSEWSIEHAWKAWHVGLVFGMRSAFQIRELRFDPVLHNVIELPRLVHDLVGLAAGGHVRPCVVDDVALRRQVLTISPYAAKTAVPIGA
jgi:hypothetical protein